MSRSLAPQGGRLAIHRLLAEAHDPAIVDAFLAEHAMPLVEGSRGTFLYRGEADSVRLKHFLYGVPSTQPFQHLAGTNLWYLVLEIPENSRIEYKLEVTVNGATRLIEDPLNPDRTRDPFGTNSVVHGSGYEVPEWVLPDPESRPGQLEDLVLRSPSLGRDARVTLYLPARFRRSHRYPLLVVHDGGDFLEYAAMKTVLDNLIHRLDVAETIVAFTYPERRLVEYADDPAHAAFLTRELVPKLEARYPLVGLPRGRCLLGASFGAVASLAAAWRNPGWFGGLCLQSGSFAYSDAGPHTRAPVFDSVVDFVNAFRLDPKPVADRAFVSCGAYESVLHENRSLVRVLERTGMEVRYVEARDGHNWDNWRDRLREALAWLLPGPLWMVYE